MGTMAFNFITIISDKKNKSHVSNIDFDCT